MKKTIFFLFFLFLSTSGVAQIYYDQGYFINNSGVKTICLINNLEWYSNPTKITYKLSEDGEKKFETIETIKEFGVLGGSIYKRFDINMDRSSELTGNLSTKRNPTFKKELLFLKVLVEGKASLYMYRESNLKRYFYQVDNEPAAQLVYKSYSSYTINEINNRLDRSHYIKKNNSYKQQIWTNLNCANITEKEIERLDYTKNDLTKFFVKYNTCKKSTSILSHENKNNDVTIIKKKNHGRFVNISIKPRLNRASGEKSKINTNETTSLYTNEIVFGIGFEAEFILPINNNEWSIFIEPESNIKGSTRLPIGVRYTASLNSTSNLYFNGSYSLLLPEIAGGIGYKYKKFIIEVRYGAAQGKTPYILQKTNYTNLALMVGFNFF